MIFCIICDANLPKYVSSFSALTAFDALGFFTAATAAPFAINNEKRNQLLSSSRLIDISAHYEAHLLVLSVVMLDFDTHVGKSELDRFFPDIIPRNVDVQAANDTCKMQQKLCA